MREKLHESTVQGGADASYRRYIGTKISLFSLVEDVQAGEACLDPVFLCILEGPRKQ